MEHGRNTERESYLCSIRVSSVAGLRLQGSGFHAGKSQVTAVEPKCGGDGAWPPANHCLKELLELLGIAELHWAWQIRRPATGPGADRGLRGRLQLAILLPFQHVVSAASCRRAGRVEPRPRRLRRPPTDPPPGPREKTAQHRFSWRSWWPAGQRWTGGVDSSVSPNSGWVPSGDFPTECPTDDAAPAQLPAGSCRPLSRSTARPRVSGLSILRRPGLCPLGRPPTPHHPIGGLA